MEFKIIEHGTDNFYIIQLMSNGSWRDTRTIARRLGLSLGEYLNILKFHGANIEDGSNRFNNRRNAEKCIEFLEPYLMMSKLTEE